MNYKKHILLIIYFLFTTSCIEELDITEFTNNYISYEPELRIEALMLPENGTAIIRIDKTISIDDQSLFDCVDDNDNWLGSGCICGIDDKDKEEENYIPICPETDIECATVGGIWLEGSILGNPSLDGYCGIANIILEEDCISETFDFIWSIIDDVGEDGVMGDPTDDDNDCEDCNFWDEECLIECRREESIGENNGVPDCGEPNVDEQEEITESGLIHESNCEIVQIIYNNNEVCNFTYSESAGTIYDGSGLIEFYDGSDCQTVETIISISEIFNLHYNYGGWIPDDNCPNDFFTHYEDGGYDLNIQCGDNVIINKASETIPYPVIFVDESSVDEDNVGTCVESDNIYECLSAFEINNTSFTLNENSSENILLWVSTATWYQAVQYFDPYNSCINDEVSPYPYWIYYHGHPAAALPPGEDSSHFPVGDSPVIYTGIEFIASATQEDVGCYQYKVYTFSEGYQNYYFYSQLDLKDPVRSNLRDQDGEVVIGGFGAISGEIITFEIISN